MLHFCGEVRLNHWYRRASEWHTEPVIKRIYELIARDEARHGGAYLRFMKRAIERSGDEAKRAFAKIGVLMASPRRAGKPLHPTNLHVNQTLFPNDTVQSRLPDPAWLERWLDEQIAFDASWEKRVIGMILHNLVEPVRADVRVGAAAEPLPQVARARLMTPRTGTGERPSPAGSAACGPRSRSRSLTARSSRLYAVWAASSVAARRERCGRS